MKMSEKEREAVNELLGNIANDFSCMHQDAIVFEVIESLGFDLSPDQQLAVCMAVSYANPSGDPVDTILFVECVLTELGILRTRPSDYRTTSRASIVNGRVQAICHDIVDRYFSA